VLDGRRSVREVAGEPGINHETLRNWLAAKRRERADGPAALTADERLELARLRREVAELELEWEILKSRGLLRSGDGPVSRGLLYEFIDAEKTGSMTHTGGVPSGDGPPRLVFRSDAMLLQQINSGPEHAWAFRRAEGPAPLTTSAVPGWPTPALNCGSRCRARQDSNLRARDPRPSP
jgi:transposase